MTTYKRVDGNYVITTINEDDNVVVNTHTLEVNGNLDVIGNLTYINVTELNIKDPFIILNASNTGAYAANSGILTHESSSSYAGLRYNANTATWQVSTSTDATGETGTWTPLSTGNTATPGGADTQVQFNDAGSLAGNANFTFDKTTSNVAITGYVTLQGRQIFGNIGSAPSAVANTVTVYHNAEGSGGTGLFIKSTTTEDELVSKSKAIVYAIIF